MSDRTVALFRVPSRVCFVSPAGQGPSCIAGGEPRPFGGRTASVFYRVRARARFVSGAEPRPLCVGLQTDPTLYRDAGQRVRFTSRIANWRSASVLYVDAEQRGRFVLEG